MEISMEVIMEMKSQHKLHETYTKENYIIT